MVQRASIEFLPASEPITEHATKFGGQPNWLTEPQWPLSKSTGRPMQFICQIALTPELFGAPFAQMAYVFMTHDDDEWVDDTWDADGGENAIILQPGQPSISTQPLKHGPSLYAMIQQTGKTLLQPMPVEFAVKLTLSEDQDFVDEDKQLEWDEARSRGYVQALQGNKIGGTPYFIQSSEFPIKARPRLLLQLDSIQVPFHINFGDAGVGYAFISEDGKMAKFLWQCF